MAAPPKLKRRLSKFLRCSLEAAEATSQRIENAFPGVSEETVVHALRAIPPSERNEATLIAVLGGAHPPRVAADIRAAAQRARSTRLRQSASNEGPEENRSDFEIGDSVVVGDSDAGIVTGRLGSMLEVRLQTGRLIQTRSTTVVAASSASTPRQPESPASESPAPSRLGLALQQIIEETNLKAESEPGMIGASVRYVEGTRARWASEPPELSEDVQRALEVGGKGQFYRHQAEAISCLRAGRNVILSTPYVSG